MAEKKAKIPRNSSSRPRKGRGKGKNSLPRLVLDLGKILLKVSSSLDDPSRTSAVSLLLSWLARAHGKAINLCWLSLAFITNWRAVVKTFYVPGTSQSSWHLVPGPLAWAETFHYECSSCTEPLKLLQLIDTQSKSCLAVHWERARTGVSWAFQCRKSDLKKIYIGVLSKWEFFIKMTAAFLASILPRVRKEGESKAGSSHFYEKLSIW